MVAAAIVGAAVVGAGATVAASSNSANATQNATNASIAEQNSALSQQASLSAPYRQLGTDAMGTYESLLGIGGSGSSSSAIQSALANTPGYQFTLNQGEQGILNAASAQGGITGNTLASLDSYNSGLASNTYQSVLGDYANAVQTGQAAAAGQAQNVGNAASNISSSITSQGQTTAGIDANEAAALSKVAGNASNEYTTYQALQALNS